MTVLITFVAAFLLLAVLLWCCSFYPKNIFDKTNLEITQILSHSKRNLSLDPVSLIERDKIQIWFQAPILEGVDIYYEKLEVSVDILMGHLSSFPIVTPVQVVLSKYSNESENSLAKSGLKLYHNIFLSISDEFDIKDSNEIQYSKTVFENLSLFHVSSSLSLEDASSHFYHLICNDVRHLWGLEEVNDDICHFSRAEMSSINYLFLQDSLHQVQAALKSIKKFNSVVELQFYHQIISFRENLNLLVDKIEKDSYVDDSTERFIGLKDASENVSNSRIFSLSLQIEHLFALFSPFWLPLLVPMGKGIMLWYKSIKARPK